jgi:hypothetical protein
VSVEDPDRPLRLRKSILFSARSPGASACWSSPAIGSIRAGRGWTADLLKKAFFHSFNTTAVAFWIVFGLRYFIIVRLSPAALDWERRLQLADEIFRREKALGRGSWWM